MSKAKGKSFEPVNKIYDTSDYEKKNQVSQGLAETHEQVSDAYMVGDIVTHDPSQQDKG